MEAKNNPEKPGQKVLITGCSSGFGLLTAVQAARSGFDVIATMRNLNKAEPLKSALAQANVSARTEELDVTAPDSIAAFLEKIGPVDILVNNAGIIMFAPVLELNEAEWDALMDVNVKAQFLELEILVIKSFHTLGNDFLQKRFIGFLSFGVVPHGQGIDKHADNLLQVSMGSTCNTTADDEKVVTSFHSNDWRFCLFEMNPMINPRISTPPPAKNHLIV